MGMAEADAARRQMAERGVELTVQEDAGVPRNREPVTSGVPLPQGAAKDPENLTLCRAGDQPTPCQFTPLCRWPDGSLKWVLLDFQTDLAASNSAAYTLRVGGQTNLPPDQPVRVVSLRSEAGALKPGPSIREPGQAEPGVALDAGDLKVLMVTNAPGVAQTVIWQGEKLVSAANPIQAEIVTEDGKTYRGGRPSRIEVECAGPLRATVLVRGQFVQEDGTPLMAGRIGYDCRLTLYAGRPFLKLDFTIKNDGSHENKAQWLFARSLTLTMPADAQQAGSAPWRMDCAAGESDLGDTEPAELTQWYKYPYENRMNWPYHEGWRRVGSSVEAEREKRIGLSVTNSGFYAVLRRGDDLQRVGDRVEGWMELSRGGQPLVAAWVRHFWQNYPAGLLARPGRLDLHLWPEGSFWPRVLRMADRNAYQFEGKRFKTYEIWVCFGEAAGKLKAEGRRFEQPLFARAPGDWYAATGAVWPLARVGIEPDAEDDIREAAAQYDRLQRAKVHAEEGDPSGPLLGRNLPPSLPFEVFQPWGRVSIGSLREECPDAFFGFMNYGDLVWAWGYCSLFYDWPYGMLIQSLRFGDETMFQLADDMARHRADIDRGSGWQHYEKGYHGCNDWVGRKKYRERGYRPHASHTWNRGLLLHWALTGEARSREAAEENGRAFFDLLKKGTNVVNYSEYRTPGWGIDACLAVYEYLGKKEYLDKAAEIFDRTLLGMEQRNGGKGHILPGGQQSAQFTGYIIEPVCRLHHLTGRQDVVQFLARVLDWHRRAGTAGGNIVDGKYWPIIFLEEWVDDLADLDYDPSASVAYDFLFADGYAYLYDALGWASDLAVARRVFRDSMFYYGVLLPADPAQRTPLGFHLYGDCSNMSAKLHAWSTRYHQLYLAAEQNRLRPKD